MDDLKLMPQQQESQEINSAEHRPPEKTSFIKKHWLKALSIVVIVGVSVFAGIQTYYVNSFRKIALDNKNLYLSENKKTDSLRAALEKTEEGKKLLETVNKDLKVENEKLDKRADTAEQDLSKTQKELNAKRKELDGINSQISSMNKELDSKKTEISKLNNGIAKFAELETYIAQFEEANITYIENIDKCIENVNLYMQMLSQYYLDQANSYLTNARRQYSIMSSSSEKMHEIFDAIKSGNY